MSQGKVLSARPRSLKQWKNDAGPLGWNDPDPMPNTESRELVGKTREQLEDLLCEVERAIGLVTYLLHDESGVKDLIRYIGIAVLGGMVTYSVTAGKDAPWLLGVIALLCLVFGFLSMRKARKTIILESRKYDRERVIRALDRAKK